MKKIYSFKKVLFLLAMSCVSFIAYAQPTVLYTSLTSTTPSPSNSRFTLNTVGGFRQYRFQSGQTVASGGSSWAFHIGTTGSPNYSPSWRPLSGGNTLSANNFIPTSFANGAKYSGTGAGSDGLLPAITNGNYYTFNVGTNSGSDNVMQLLETTFSPVTMTIADAASTYGSRKVTITTSGTPNASENLFVRYTLNGYTNSIIVQATGSGTTWTATIPWQVSAVSYYAYSSNKTLAQINSDVTTYGQTAHDMSSLNVSAGGSYTPATGAIIVSSAGGTFAAGIGYASLTNAAGAFSALNGASSGTNAVTILVTADVATEAGTNALNASANWTSINMQPSGGRTLSGAPAAGTPLINLNGADNVTIDGLNTGGNTLTISNTTASATAATSTIQFAADATSNTIQNCTINGSSTAGNSGSAVGTATIYFAGATSTGNDNNTIQNCTIGAAGANLPSTAIYSYNATANADNIQILNNNIQDYFSAANNSYGIYAGTNNNTWTITGNKFFQQATRTSTGGSTHEAIKFTSGNGHIISTNIIGYATSGGTGTTFYAGAFANRFIGIDLAVGTTTATSVQGNTISNFNLSTTSGASTANGIFTGIYVTAGNVNLGTTTGNLIGNSGGTGFITITNTTSGSLVNGIASSSTGTVNIQNNTVASYSCGGTSGIGYLFNGIVTSGAAGIYTISNNTIGGTVAGSIALGILGTTTTACTFTGILNSATGATIIGSSGNPNTIQNVAMNPVATNVFIGISNTGTPATLNVNYNVIKAITFPAASAHASTFTGISNSGAVTTTININNNSLGVSGTGLVTYTAAASGTLTGISNTGGAATAALSVQTNDFRGITHTAAASSAHNYIINTAATLSQNISSNTFTTLSVNTTGSVAFMSNDVALPSGGSVTASSNSIGTSFNKTGAGGTVTLYLTTTGPSSVSGTTKTEQSNNFSNITCTGATTIAGWADLEGATSSGPTKTISGNTFSTWTTGGANINVIQCQYATGGASSISTNTISGMTGAGAITGITTPSTNVGTSMTIGSNPISSLTSTGGTVIGVSCAAAPTTDIISGNTISTLSSTSASVIGINYTAGTASKIFKNKIYDISSSNAAALVYGIYVNAGTTNTLYNNIVGDLRATSATQTAPTPAIVGIYLNSGTTNNIYNNTVRITGAGGTNFGTAALYASTTPTTLLINNLLVNLCTPSGTGKTVAYQRSSTTVGTHSTTSNKNSYYSGDATFSTASKPLYFDGTNSDLTLAALKSRLTTGEANSLAENPTFAGTTGSLANFLHISAGTSTALESGGVNNPASSFYTDDFDGDARPGPAGSVNGGASSYDIGADEFDGVPIDVTAPTITYTALTNAAVATTRSFTAVTITDVSGVNGTTGTRPRVYYKKSTDANTYAGNTSGNNGWKFVEANGSTSNFDFTIDYSLLQGGAVSAGDVIQYFVVAQDNATTPNVGINSGIFAATPTSVALTSAAFALTGSINSYTIVASFSGPYSVGTGQTYTSLTAAGGFFAAINAGVVTGDVTINITSDISIETGANVLNEFTSSYNLTIKPSGAARAVSGTASAGLITINGADNVTIDGSLAGASNAVCPVVTSSRDLTFTNNNTGTSSAVIWLQTASSGTTPAATNNTVKNCIITGSGNTQTLFGIGSGGTTVSTSSLGTSNNNNSFVNNNISKTKYGIYSQGASAGTKNSGTVINQNLINTTTPNNVQVGAISVGFENNITISGNVVDGITSGSDCFGISVGLTAIATATNSGNEVTNATISNNKIGTVVSTGATGAAGITLASATSGTTTLSNNVITGVGGNATPTDFNAGIILGGGTGSTTRVYFNSVSMTGTFGSGTAPIFAIAVIASNPVLDIRNNIFYTTQTTGSGVRYAIGLGYPSPYSNLTINNNDYFTSTLGSAGSFATSASANSVATPVAATTLAAFKTATSTSTGNDASSISTDPAFNSTTNLVLQTGSGAVGTGVAGTGITTDIICATRTCPPSMGAYDVATDAIGPTISYTAITSSCTTGARSFSATITDASGVPTSGTGLPYAYYKINSAVSYTAVQGTFGSGSTYNFSVGAGAVGGDVVTYYVAAQDNVGNVSTFPVAGSSGFTSSPPAASTPPTTPSTYSVYYTMNTTYNVGAGQTFTTLTAAVNAYNNACVTGPVVFSLTDAGYGSETFPITINANAGASATNTLTIKPTQSSTTMSGTSASALIVLNGADYVTIDGSTSATVNAVCPVATATRNLTLTNTNSSTTSAVIWLQTNVADGATNNVIKNINLVGSGNTQTFVGVGSGSTTIGSGSTGTGNISNSFINNNISKTQYGIFSQGASAANKNTGTIINQNLINTASTNNVAAVGIYAGFENGITISGNTIDNLQAPSTTDGFAIALGSNAITNSSFSGNEVINATVTNNIIGLVRGASTYSAVGIYIPTTTNTGTTLIANNMISGVNANGTSGDLAAGIFLGNVVGTVNVYYNTVTMIGTLSGGGYPSFAFASTSSATVLNIKNNIFTSTGSTGANLNRAMGFAHSTYTNLTSNNNDLYVSGTGAAVVQTVNLTNSGATSYTTVLGAGSWNTASAKDAASISVAPSFILSTATDLHLNTAGNSTLNSGGTPVSVTTDIDCTTRDANLPDIGADEFIAPCVAPTTQATAPLTLTPQANGTAINGSFSAAAAPLPGGYIVVRTTSASVPSPGPQNATTYSVGTSAAATTDFGSGAYVESVGTSLTFSSTGLTPGTTYYYWVFTYNNTLCTGGPLYNTVSPLNNSATTLTPCITPTAQPTVLVFSNVAATTLSGSFTAASGVSDYLVVRTTSNTAPSPGPQNASGVYALGTSGPATTDFGTGAVVESAGPSLTFNSTGLSLGTTYYYYIYSYSNTSCTGGPLYYTTSPLTGNATTLGCPSPGTYSLGPTGTYSSIGQVVNLLTNCTLSGPYIFELQSSYVSTVETFPITIPLFAGTSTTNTVTFRPATGASNLSITSSNTTGTILFDGGQNIIFDGRAGGSGTTKDLTVENTNVGTSYAVRFVNDGSGNTFEYCNIKSANSGTSSGTIVFATAATGTTGNDNNIIDHNDIFDAGTGAPSNGVYALGTASPKDNSGNVISNNNIYNYHNAVTTSANIAGVNINTGNTDWTISGNSFYQTGSRSYAAGSTVNGIFISSTSGNNFVITGNYIGGGASSCGGSAWAMTTAPILRAIQMSVGTTTASSVQGNTIQNISVTSSSTSTSQSGLSLISGSINAGNTTANTIGSQSITGSIAFSISGTGAIVSGIAAGSGTPGVMVISNNTIGGISLVNTGAPAAGTSLRGIGFQGAATSYAISNNTVGSLTTAGSFTSSAANSILGIFGSATNTGNTISGNTIANVTQTNSTSTSAFVTGIAAQGSSGGSYSVTGNTVRDISSASIATATNNAAAVSGIAVTAATTAGQTVSQNTIYSLTASASAAAVVHGIYYSGPTTGTNIVNRNFIHTLNATGSSSAVINGISAVAGLTNYNNNMVRLGTTTTLACSIKGITETGGTNNFYFNSVYIGGSGIASGNVTYGFISSVTVTTRDYSDNIFFNARSNTSSGGTKHYGYRIAGTSGLTSDYNDIFVSGTDGTFASNAGSDVVSLGAWQTATSKDANSKSGDPKFLVPTGTVSTVDLHIDAAAPTSVEGVGGSAAAVSAVSDDFDGQTRSGLTPTDIGADAGNFIKGNDIGATALTAPSATGCYGAAENVTVTIKNYSNSTIDFAVNPATVTVNVTGAVTQTLGATVSSGTLAGGATQSVTMSTTLDMSTVGTYTFNGSATVSGDVGPGNDAFAATTRTVTVLTATPYSQNFDASTVTPANWTNTSVWTIGTTHANPATGNGLYYNLYSSAATSTPQFILPRLGPVTATDVLSFDYRIVDYTSYPATATTNGSAWGSIVIMASTDCGNSYSTFQTINNANHVSSLSWATKTYSLSSFAGQTVIFKYVCTWLTGDYYIDFDNFNIATPCSGTPTAGTASASVTSGCASVSSSVLSLTGTSTTSGLTYQWKSASVSGGPYTDISGATLSTLTVSNVLNTTYYVCVVTCSNGGASATSGEATITVVKPAVTPALPTICAGSSVSLTASGMTSYTWSPSTGLSATTGATVSANPASTTTYTVTGTAGACVTSTAVTVVVNPLPSTVTITPSSVTMCANDAAQLLTASGSTVANTTILNENFNGTATGWTMINNSTGGTNAALAAWTARADGYIYSSYGTWHSNDNTQFIMTNSDAQGSGGTTATILQSPAFSTANYTAVTLGFYHYFYEPTAASSTGKVEASVDGLSWTTLQTYNSTTGAVGTFATGSVSLTAPFLNKPLVYIRFKFDGVYRYFWGIDNVTLTGTQTQSYSWTPNNTGNGLYTDAAATTLYTGGASATVYAKPTVSGTVYTATSTSASGCQKTNTVTITINPISTAAVLSLSGTSPICNGSSSAIKVDITGGTSPYSVVYNDGTNHTVSSYVSGADITVSPTTSTTYTLVSVTSSGTPACPGTGNSGTATVNVTQPITFGNIQSPASGAICQTGSFDVYGQVFKTGVTPGAGQGANITAEIGYSSSNTNPNGGSWTWASATYNSSVTGSNDEYKGTLSGLAAGTYYYAFRYQTSPCTYVYGGYSGSGGGFWNGSTNVNGTLTVAGTPTTADAGPDQTDAATCALTTTTLAANTPTVGTGAWSVTSGAGGSFGNAASPTSTFTGTAGITYTLRWTISSGSCTTSTDDVNVKFNGLGFANLQSPTGGNICQTGVFDAYGQVFVSGLTPGAGEGTTVTAWLGYSSTNNDPSGSGWTWVLAHYNTLGPTANNDEYMGTLSGLSPGTYYYAFRYQLSPCGYQYGGYSGGGGGFWNGTTNVNGSFTVVGTPTTADAGPDQTNSATCGVTSTTLAANAATVGTGAWSIVSGTGGSFGNAASPTSTFSGTANTAYVLRWTITSSPCTASTDDVNITFSTQAGFVNTQFPASGTVCSPTTFTAYGQVFKSGVTEAAGQGAGITADLGYSTSNTNPNTWTNWVAATFNVQSGNNDEYKATLSGLAAGTYYYAYRFQAGPCAYQYGGYSGSGGGTWNGSTNVSGVLTINAPSTAPTTANSSGSTMCAAGTVHLTQTGGVLGTGAYFQWATDAGFSNIIGNNIVSSDATLDVIITSTTTYYVRINGGTAPCSTTATSSVNVTVTATADTWSPTAANNNWSDPANWCGGVPDKNTNVVIPTSTNYPIVGSGTAYVNNISIATGASFTVDGAGILSLHGTISNSGTLDMTDGTLKLAGSSQTISGATFASSTIKNLIDSTSASLTSTSNDILNLTGTFTFGNTSGSVTFTTGGNLVLKSSSSTTASIGDITNNGATPGNSISGNASVERYIPAGRRWRFIAVNTTGGSLTVQNSYMEAQTPGANNGPAGYGMWITGTGGTGAGFDASTTTPTMKWWDGSVYTGITDPTAYNLRSHSAYMLFIRGDRGSTGGNSTLSSTVLRSTGALTQGTTGNTTVASGSAYYGLGNPYASAVDLAKLNYSGGTTTINVAVWDPNLGGGYGLGAFQYLSSDGPGQDFTITPGGGSYGSFNSVMNTIESGQGFFMAGTGFARDVNFNEPAKTPKAHDVFFVPGQTQKIVGMLYIKDASSNLTLLDGLQVKFNSAYNTSADPDDARKLVNGSENVSVKRNTELMAIELRNLPAATDTVQLNISGMRTANYQWKFDLNNMDAPLRSAWLVDRFQGNLMTPLNLTGSNIYNFTVNGGTSNAADRFLIVFGPQGVVPVTLTGISATRLTDKTIAVKWNTENEINIDHYEVERSANGNNFGTIATAAATNNAGGNASYMKIDANPLDKDNYYRIKAISVGGRFQFSAIVKVSPLTVDQSITVYPNPMTDRVMNIRFTNKAAGHYTLQLVNKAGQTVFADSETISGSNEVKSIRLPQRITAGGYDLLIRNNEGEREVVSVIVE